MAAPPSSSSSSSAASDPPFLLSAARSMQSLADDFLSRLNPNRPNSAAASSKTTTAARAPPLIGAPSPTSSSPVAVPLLLPSSFLQTGHGHSSPPSAIRTLSSSARTDGLGLGSKGGGPAFVGQVFSMLDPSGNGLMAVTTHFDIPFLSKRTPEWVKKMIAMVSKSEEKGPVFRFFMDLSDAVSYVKRLNIPTGMVGACRLDVAYEHFKEKPHMFQFVPNEKQVKAANKLLKTIPQKRGRRKLDGVPVFTAQNLNIAIASNDGIKWYTPYFFDKKLLDNILEASMDQHFQTLIQNRHTRRRRDVFDDSLTAEVVEENGDGLFDPPEVQEVLDEMGHLDIPLSVISKAAEIKLLDVVDKVLLGNKWLRKAAGIQPKFPYLVDSFEERSAAAFHKEAEDANRHQPETQQLGPSEINSRISEEPVNPLLPKITMVGISMGDGGQVSKTNLKKTMEDLTMELEQKSSKVDEDKDPLFVANVGDYSSIVRMSST